MEKFNMYKRSSLVGHSIIDEEKSFQIMTEEQRKNERHPDTLSGVWPGKISVARLLAENHFPDWHLVKNTHYKRYWESQ
jgi:hypothetical protein